MLRTIGSPDTALSRTGDVVAAATGGDAARPTPCSEWTVADLIGHPMVVPDGFRVTAQGGQPDWTVAPPTMAADDWSDNWSRCRTALVEAWRGSTVDPAGAEFQIAETIVHDWDLAIACGRPFVIDGAPAEEALALARGAMDPTWRGARNAIWRSDSGWSGGSAGRPVAGLLRA